VSLTNEEAKKGVSTQGPHPYLPGTGALRPSKRTLDIRASKWKGERAPNSSNRGANRSYQSRRRITQKRG